MTLFFVLSGTPGYLTLTKYASLDELEQAIRKYIDYYNTERTKDKLKELTPIEYHRNLSTGFIIEP